MSSSTQRADELALPNDSQVSFVHACKKSSKIYTNVSLARCRFLHHQPANWPGLVWYPLNVLAVCLIFLTFGWFQVICGISNFPMVSLSLFSRAQTAKDANLNCRKSWPFMLWPWFLLAWVTTNKKPELSEKIPRSFLKAGWGQRSESCDGSSWAGGCSSCCAAKQRSPEHCSSFLKIPRNAEWLLFVQQLCLWHPSAASPWGTWVFYTAGDQRCPRKEQVMPGTMQSTISFIVNLILFWQKFVTQAWGISWDIFLFFGFVFCFLVFFLWIMHT